MWETMVSPVLSRNLTRELMKEFANTTTQMPVPTNMHSHVDFCAAFSSPFCREVGWNLNTLELLFIALLIVPHVSMIVFLIAHGRKDTSFRQAFYVQFVVVSIVDCIRVAWVRTWRRSMLKLSNRTK